MVVGRGPTARLRRGARSEDAATAKPEAIDRQALERAVKDELERREHVQRTRARLTNAKARVEAHVTEQARFNGGPCVYCGVHWSAERDERGGLRPRWHQVTAGPSCALCDEDRHPLGSSIPLNDEQHRERVVRRLVGEEVARRWWGSYIVEKTGFKWWHETPDASPGERFTYVDVNAMRAVLAPSEPTDPPYSKGAPCPRCGCAHMWVLTPEGVAIMTHDPTTGNELKDPVRLKVQAGRVCHGCIGYPDVEALAERLVGIDGRRSERARDDKTGLFFDGQSAAHRIGLTWYEDRDRSRDGRRDRTLTPFAYLDLDELRRKAYELFPDQSMWRSKAIWQRLHDETEARR